MQVILLEKISNLGDLGDVVNVKDGFGRNFLIPQGKAKRATEANKAEFEARRAELEKQQAALIKAAEKKAKDLEGFKLDVKQKAGIDGKLFGSVTNIDIAEALTAAKHEVEKSEIRMPDGPIKTTGEHEITIALHHDVTVQIMVSVTAEEA
jgi:large subunit ribosomal protein L9